MAVPVLCLPPAPYPPHTHNPTVHTPEQQCVVLVAKLLAHLLLNRRHGSLDLIHQARGQLNTWCVEKYKTVVETGRDRQAATGQHKAGTVTAKPAQTWSANDAVQLPLLCSANTRRFEVHKGLCVLGLGRTRARAHTTLCAPPDPLFAAARDAQQPVQPLQEHASVMCSSCCVLRFPAGVLCTQLVCAGATSPVIEVKTSAHNNYVHNFTPAFAAAGDARQTASTAVAGAGSHTQCAMCFPISDQITHRPCRTPRTPRW